jgi:hypothetical protein
MKSMGIIGVVLILFGGTSLAVRRISYTTEKPVLELGPLTASVTEQHSFALPDVAGIGLMILGGVLVLISQRAVKI